jgi:hypothetical protein
MGMRLSSLAFYLVQLPGLALGAAISPTSPPAPSALDSQEIATYRITYGILGQIGEAQVTLTPDSAAHVGMPVTLPRVRAVGTGAGALLGLARTQKRIETELDAGNLVAVRFTNVTTTRARKTEDAVTQSQPGSLELLRKRTGEPDLAEKFNRNTSVLDPLGFLLRLRAELPATTTSYEVLDGRALWLVTVSPAQSAAETPWLIRLEGRFDPVYWNGSPDPQREARSFVLFLASDRSHLPVRLVVPFGAGQIQADLAHVERPEAPGRRPRGGFRWCQAWRSPKAWSLAVAETMRTVSQRPRPSTGELIRR